MASLKKYYELVKPGIIYGNAITTAAGFFLAARGHIDWRLFIAALAGISLVIASGCVFNNYIDRGIDAKMSRTKDRALVLAQVPVKRAVVYGIVLGLVGVFVLGQFTNLLTLIIALIGWVVYVILYGYFKRHSIYGTLVGAVAGAVPPLVGYCAVTNRFDAGALILFLILCFWQIPHFFAIAIYRFDDYASAGLPVWPVKKGIASTKIQIVLYIVGFIVCTALLQIMHYAGYFYLAVAMLLGLVWLFLGLGGFKSRTDNKLWARKMFLFSLVVITVLSITMSISGVI